MRQLHWQPKLGAQLLMNGYPGDLPRRKWQSGLDGSFYGSRDGLEGPLGLLPCSILLRFLQGMEWQIFFSFLYFAIARMCPLWSFSWQCWPPINVYPYWDEKRADTAGRMGQTLCPEDVEEILCGSELGLDPYNQTHFYWYGEKHYGCQEIRGKGASAPWWKTRVSKRGSRRLILWNWMTSSLSAVITLLYSLICFCYFNIALFDY